MASAGAQPPSHPLPGAASPLPAPQLGFPCSLPSSCPARASFSLFFQRQAELPGLSSPLPLTAAKDAYSQDPCPFPSRLFCLSQHVPGAASTRLIPPCLVGRLTESVPRRCQLRHAKPGLESCCSPWGCLRAWASRRSQRWLLTSGISPGWGGQ